MAHGVVLIVVQVHRTGYRFILLMASGIFVVFGSRTVHFSGAGPLGVLTIAFVSALHWRKELTKSLAVGFYVSTLFYLCNFNGDFFVEFNALEFSKYIASHNV